jgi:hypothetical protein
MFAVEVHLLTLPLLKCFNAIVSYHRQEASFHKERRETARWIDLQPVVTGEWSS